MKRGMIIVAAMLAGMSVFSAEMPIVNTKFTSKEETSKVWHNSAKFRNIQFNKDGMVMKGGLCSYQRKLPASFQADVTMTIIEKNNPKSPNASFSGMMLLPTGRLYVMSAGRIWPYYKGRTINATSGSKMKPVEGFQLGKPMRLSISRKMLEDNEVEITYKIDDKIYLQFVTDFSDADKIELHVAGQKSIFKDFRLTEIKGKVK